MCFSWVGDKINLRRLATRRVLRLDSQHVVQLNKFKVNSWAYIKGDHVSRSTQVGKQSRHYLNILATKTHEFFLFLPYTTCLPWTCPIILLGQAWCFRCPWGAGILRSLMDLMGRKLQKLLVFIDFPWFSYQLSETNMAMFTAEILVEHQENPANPKTRKPLIHTNVAEPPVARALSFATRHGKTAPWMPSAGPRAPLGRQHGTEKHLVMCTPRGEGTARRNSASSSSALKRRRVEVLEMLDRWLLFFCWSGWICLDSVQWCFMHTLFHGSEQPCWLYAFAEDPVFRVGRRLLGPNGCL